MNDRSAGRATGPVGVLDPVSVEACCAVLYGDPAIELVLGESLHPGGLAATATLLDESGVPPGSRLLDLGCGTGASSWLAAERSGLLVIGLDPSEAALRRARSRGHGRDGAAPSDADSQPDPTFVGGIATELPFADGSFDAVLAECVLSTLDKPRALDEVRRVLVPGGRLLLSDMTIADPMVVEDAAFHPVLAAALCLGGAWLPGELEGRLDAAGFETRGPRDESASLAALLERASARIDLLRIVARDIGSGLRARLADAGAGDIRDVLAALAWARDAARDGRIGYASVVATRV